MQLLERVRAAPCNRGSRAAAAAQSSSVLRASRCCCCSHAAAAAAAEQCSPVPVRLHALICCIPGTVPIQGSGAGAAQQARKPQAFATAAGAASRQAPQRPASPPPQAASLLQGYVREANSDASKPVINLASPEELRAAFAAAGVPMSLESGQAPVGAAALAGAQLISWFSCCRACWGCCFCRRDHADEP